jgi:ABC-2 type transport system ATP-binding protein
MKAIEVDNLTRDFNGLRAVNQLTFDVDLGEIFGFLGPNGAGKTTTIKMLTGQLRPTMGTAKVLGWDIVADREQFKPRIGVVFEHQNLYQRLSGYDNLRFIASLYGVEKTRIQEVLTQVGLAGCETESVKKYSNGMKQRLLIARALLHKPQVIFLDEPTKGLDPGIAREIRRIVISLSNQGIAIFLTTHYMEEADQLCQRVAIINRGLIIAMDAPSLLKNNNGAKTTTLEDVFIHLTGKDLYR